MTLLQIRNIDTANETFEAKFVIEQQWMMTRQDGQDFYAEKHGEKPWSHALTRRPLNHTFLQQHVSHPVVSTLSMPPRSASDDNGYEPEWHPADLEFTNALEVEIKPAPYRVTQLGTMVRQFAWSHPLTGRAPFVIHSAVIASHANRPVPSLAVDVDPSVYG